MAKKGKTLEQLVAKIQDVVKDKEDTSIEVNARLRDRDNVLREFDVLVRTTIQGLPSIIAFECKDFSTSKSKPSVDVKIVDGFNTKCTEFPEIKQKIIVSATGFSENAKIKASSFGINLLALEDVSLDSIVNREVTLLKSISKLGDIWYYHYDDNQICESRDILDLWDSKTDKKIDALKFIKTLFFRSNLFQEQTKAFIENGRKPLNSNLKVDVNGRLYIKDDVDKKHLLRNIVIPIIINFEENNGRAEKAQKMTQGVLEIDTITYGFDNNNIKLQSIETASKKECYFQVDDKYIKPEFKGVI